VSKQYQSIISKSFQVGAMRNEVKAQHYDVCFIALWHIPFIIFVLRIKVSLRSLTKSSLPSSLHPSVFHSTRKTDCPNRLWFKRTGSYGVAQTQPWTLYSGYYFEIHSFHPSPPQLHIAFFLFLGSQILIELLTDLLHVVSSRHKSDILMLCCFQLVVGR
jgi:hypothetical protein